MYNRIKADYRVEIPGTQAVVYMNHTADIPEEWHYMIFGEEGQSYWFEYGDTVYLREGASPEFVARTAYRIWQSERGI